MLAIVSRKVIRHLFRAPLKVALILLILVLLTTACQTQSPELQPILLPMGYVANVQFSPFYVAKENGYFQDQGFDVDFDYRWETDGIQFC